MARGVRDAVIEIENASGLLFQRKCSRCQKWLDKRVACTRGRKGSAKRGWRNGDDELEGGGWHVSLWRTLSMGRDEISHTGATIFQRISLSFHLPNADARSPDHRVTSDRSTDCHSLVAIYQLFFFVFSSFFFNGDPLVGWLAMSNSSELESWDCGSIERVRQISVYFCRTKRSLIRIVKP